MCSWYFFVQVQWWSFHRFSTEQHLVHLKRWLKPSISDKTMMIIYFCTHLKTGYRPISPISQRTRPVHVSLTLEARREDDCLSWERRSWNLIDHSWSGFSTHEHRDLSLSLTQYLQLSGCLVPLSNNVSLYCSYRVSVFKSSFCYHNRKLFKGQKKQLCLYSLNV